MNNFTNRSRMIPNNVCQPIICDKPCRFVESCKNLEESNAESVAGQKRPKKSPLVTHQEAVDEVRDMGQAVRRGRGQPKKKEGLVEGGDYGGEGLSGPGKGSVPDMGEGCCLGPEENVVSLGEGGEGGPGPPRRRER
jgi:hypothetical protein